MEEIRARIKERRNRQARSIRRAYDLGRLEKELLEVFHREVKRLLDDSFKEALSPHKSRALLSYLQFLREYQAEKSLEKDLEKAQRASGKKTEEP